MGGDTEESVWEPVQFFKSGVASIVNCKFTRGYVPFRNGRHVVNPELGAQMTKLGDKGMCNPNPDRAYGIRSNKHDFPTFKCPRLCADAWNSYQVCTWSSCSRKARQKEGSIGETRNQACRGGAALVHCHRLLLDLLGRKDVVGADDRVLVFTTTYTDGLLDFHVHWAEVSQAGDALPI